MATGQAYRHHGRRDSACKARRQRLFVAVNCAEYAP
jgi:transcriptional regulator with AAA-type ATPase domain